MSAMGAMPLLPAIAIGCVLGIVVGSFLAALVLRWPEGKSVLRGRSMCDSCGRNLRAAELVPLISILFLRGRCRTCGVSIKALHWQMELCGGLIGVAAAYWAPMPEALGWMVLGWGLLALAILDARHFWLPDGLTLPLLLLGLTIGPFVTGVTFANSVIGAIAGYGALFLIAYAYRYIRDREGLGQGDAKLLSVLGTWFGWQALPTLLLLASVLALIWTLVSAIAAGRKLESAHMISFGTFLCIAFIPLCALRAFVPAVLG